MKRILTLLLAVVLTGCEATAVKDTASIQTKAVLSQDIQTPVQVPVAFYVDRGKPEVGVNFYGQLEKATKFVGDSMFMSAEKVSTDSKYQFLIYFKTSSRWDRTWGGWDSVIDMTVYSKTGETLYSTSTPTSTAAMTGLYDMTAIYNSFAQGTKEAITGFLNSQGSANLAKAQTDFNANPVALSLKDILGDKYSPESTGTGFFVNKNGQLVTSAHVVDQCLYLEVRHKGQKLPAKVEHFSSILDLAVVSTDFTQTNHATISNTKAPSLGKQVFVTGFPLSGILSEYPSLTMGNVSSLGGLKGSQGHFQFSAPIQPGNSGGAVVDYRGNVLGVVSSTLNQEMMLTEMKTTSQNVNFGVEVGLLKRFLDKKNISYPMADSKTDFETSSAAAVEYTNQVLCYK